MPQRVYTIPADRPAGSPTSRPAPRTGGAPAPARGEVRARGETEAHEIAPRTRVAEPRHDTGVPRRSSGNPEITPMGAPAARPGEPERSARTPAGIEFEPEPRRRSRRMPARRPARAVVAVVALYTLGGLAPLALRLGRRGFAWAIVTLLSTAAWAGLAWKWSVLRPMLAGGRLPLGPALAGLVLLTFLGAIAWSRAFVLAGRDERYRAQHLPAWLRHPALVGTLGLPAPGLGLLIAGKPVRAGLAIWNTIGVLLATLVLRHISLVWKWNAHAGGNALPKIAVELGFLSCAACAIFGGLLWIAQALDGARLAAVHHTPGSSRHGDRLALALLLAVGCFVATFRPARLASDADCLASAMRYNGYRVIPLCLELGAQSLDGGRPEYSMHVAELYRDLGKLDAARTVYGGLHERWETYAQMLLREEAYNRRPLQSQPILPGLDPGPTRSAREPVPHGALDPVPQHVVLPAPALRAGMETLSPQIAPESQDEAAPRVQHTTPEPKSAAPETKPATVEPKPAAQEVKRSAPEAKAGAGESQHGATAKPGSESQQGATGGKPALQSQQSSKPAPKTPQGATATRPATEERRGAPGTKAENEPAQDTPATKPASEEQHGGSGTHAVAEPHRGEPVTRAESRRAASETKPASDARHVTAEPKGTAQALRAPLGKTKPAAQAQHAALGTKPVAAAPRGTLEPKGGTSELKVAASDAEHVASEAKPRSSETQPGASAAKPGTPGAKQTAPEPAPSQTATPPSRP